MLLKLARYLCLVPQCGTNASTRVAAKSSSHPLMRGDSDGCETLNWLGDRPLLGLD